MKSLTKIAVLGLAAALAAEAAARLLIPMDVLAYRDSDDPALSFELLPGAHGMKNGALVEISAQGLRDELVPAAKAPGERRVVVVGGHETFGIGVGAKDTFVRELEDGLIDPREGRARTVNVSMYSYHLRQKVELACRRLPSLAPDLAVLQVTEGDGHDPYPPLLRLPRLKNWVREHSVFLRWASEWFYRRPRLAGPQMANTDFALARDQLRRFKECADAAGARAVVMLLPDITVAPASSPSDLRRGIETEAHELGMPLVDAGPALMAVPPKERAVFPKQQFLSPAAQRALADVLRRRLRPLLRKKRPAPASERRPSA